MAEVFSDLGAWALAQLKATPTVTDLVVSGEALVLEAGELTAEALAAAQETRREEGTTDCVLAVIVQDGGERDFSSHCSVFIYDRYGYANIRQVREAVISTLVNRPAVLPREACINQVKYAGRSGHAIDRLLDLDFECVNFSGALITERDIYA